MNVRPEDTFRPPVSRVVIVPPYDPVASNDATPQGRSRWNGLLPKERKCKRRSILIEAAFVLLAAEGMAGTTVRAVCARARLNPRYFYESFSDLDDLLVSLYDDVYCQLRRRTDDALAGAQDEDVALRASVDATVRFIAEDRRRGCVLYSAGLGNEALNVRRTETGMALVDLEQRDRSGRDGEAHDEHIGRLGAAVTVGGFSELLVAWLDGRVELSVEELIDDATEVFLAVWDATCRLQRLVKHDQTRVTS